MEKETKILILIFIIMFFVDNLTNYKISFEATLIFLVVSVLLFCKISYKYLRKI